MVLSQEKFIFKHIEIKGMKKLRSFTLIEMLIVVVTIWLLAAALVPRFTHSVLRARHTKRLTDLRQISSAIQVYQADNGWIVPASSMLTLDQMVTWLDKDLVPRYMTYVPLDSLYVPSSYLIWIYDYIQQWIPAWEQPAWFGQTPWVMRAVKSPWSYWYLPLAVNNQPNTSFALIAAFIEDTEYANWIIYPNSSSSRNIFVYYWWWTYTQYSSWASLTLTTVTEAQGIKDVLCDRIDESVRYAVPASIVQPDWSITCFPANNNPLAVYWYSTRDNYYRYIYIP